MVIFEKSKFFLRLSFGQFFSSLPAFS